LDAAGRAALEADAAQACRARLVASGVDPAAYTTAASAADLEDLRRVLGIAKWNLYGVSYSTRLMLAVMRDFPEGVRSAVLDSPLPPSERYDATSNAHLAQALDAVLRDCAAQPACRAAYPNLKARLYASLEEAERSPLMVSIQSPKGEGKTGNGKTGQQTVLRLGAAELVALLNLDDTGSLPGLPRLMDQIARRDAAALRPYVERTLGPKGFAWGMRYSVWCGEEAPPGAGRSKGIGGLAVPSVLARLDLSPVPAEVCRAWNVPPVPKRYTAPVRSNIPTLLIAGEYDPYTPPDWAATAARTLPNSRVLIVRGMGHVPTQVWDQPDAMKVAAAFVEAPERDPALSPAGKGVASRRPPEFTVAPVPR
jgi:pimeloyl-ACP methyl ester carboxylesterase